jgi:DNA-binding NarL/FixJ family response regulator
LILKSNDKIVLAGETGDSEEAARMATTCDPHVILLELNLDGELDTEIIPELLKAAPKARLILLTGLQDPDVINLAIQMGAVGVVAKTEPATVLLKAIEKVNAGEVWIDRAMMADVLTSLARARYAPAEQSPEIARIASLSVREREVIGLIGEGLRNKEIAERMSISEVTVRHHLSSVYSKLGVEDRLELTIYAYRNGLATLPA